MQHPKSRLHHQVATRKLASIDPNHWFSTHIVYTHKVDKTTKRGALVNFIQSHTVQVILSVLLMLDLALVVAELMVLDHTTAIARVTCTDSSTHATTATTNSSFVIDHSTTTSTHCTLQDGSHVDNGWAGKGSGSNNCNACTCTSGVLACTEKACSDVLGRRRILSAPHDENQDPTYGLLPGCTITATKELSHDLHTAEEILKYSSLVVLFIFEAELLLLWIGLGCAFLKQWVYVLDFVVVTVSLFMDLTLSSLSQEFVVVLVITRLWRFARIFHALGMTIHEVDEKVHEEHIERLEKEHMDNDGK